jgi:hypothetical protein
MPTLPGMHALGFILPYLDNPTRKLSLKKKKKKKKENCLCFIEMKLAHYTEAAMETDQLKFRFTFSTLQQ